MVNVQVARSSVSGDKQRKNVKGLRCWDLLQRHGFTGGFKHKSQSFVGFPGMAVDSWHTVRVDRSLQSKQLWLGA